MLQLLPCGRCKRRCGLVSNPISGEVGAAARCQCDCRDSDGGVSNPISGEVGAAAGPHMLPLITTCPMFQTPSAGRWVLQPTLFRVVFWRSRQSFKPHQRGGGCCSFLEDCIEVNFDLVFQTPSAGRWVLQPSVASSGVGWQRPCFKPHQRGGGCCSHAGRHRVR